MSQKRKLFQGPSLHIVLAICFLVLAMIIVVFLSGKDFDYSKLQGASMSTVPATLTVTNVSTATTAKGTITSNPKGIDCGRICSMALGGFNSKISLYATPDRFSRFVGWSGASCVGRGSCLITNNGTNKSVTATFCADVCSAFGQTRCSGTTRYQICRDYNGDSCLEWSASSLCTGSKSCDYGTCTKTQKPQWYCTGAGKCAYTCYTDKTCK